MTENAAAILDAAEVYSRGMRGLDAFLTAHRPRICPFDLLLENVPQEAEVLDIGCGRGLFLYLIWKLRDLKGAVGVDADAATLLGAQAGMRKAGASSISFLKCSSTDEWPTGPFDLVTMIDVMHHVPRGLQKAFFRAACDRVRPGGRIIYKDMASEPLWSATANRLHDLLMARQWIEYVDVGIVSAWAEELKLRQVRAAERRMLVYSHEMRVFQRPAA